MSKGNPQTNPQSATEQNQSCRNSVTIPMPTLAELDGGRSYYLKKSLRSLILIAVLAAIFMFFEPVFTKISGRTLEETGAWLLIVASFAGMPVLLVYSITLYNKSRRYTPALPWTIKKVKNACRSNGRDDLRKAIVEMEKRPIPPTSGELQLIVAILEMRGAKKENIS